MGLSLKPTVWIITNCTFWPSTVILTNWQVKLQLAEKAQRAANAAQAALAEKQNEMHMLEDQMHDAETVMLEEHDSLNQTRQNVDTAGKKPHHHFDLLKTSVNVTFSVL